MPEATKKGWASQMKNFFGLKEGETMSGFMAELKALSQAERQQFADMLNAVGYLCDTPALKDGAQ